MMVEADVPLVNLSIPLVNKIDTEFERYLRIRQHLPRSKHAKSLQRSNRLKVRKPAYRLRFLRNRRSALLNFESTVSVTSCVAQSTWRTTGLPLASLHRSQ